MAYVEVRKSGRLLTRRVVDETKARKGCRIRMGSAGQVVVAPGETKQVGKYEFAMFEGAPPEDGYEAVDGLREVSASFPSMSQTEDAAYRATADVRGGSDRPPVPAIEGYEITDRLGEGGMGTVWRAVQLSTRREVAMKFLGRHRFASKKSRARFEREVSLAAKLTHPNIARVYDSGLHRGVYYYAMELIDGVHLDAFVRENDLSQRDVLELMMDVCDGVRHAHQRGIIHRDLKPSNILVTQDGQPHIVDFGLAKASMKEEDDLSISIEGEIAGTLAYMSPEQAAGRTDKISERTDVYSLGVILHELLTGRLPHDMSGSRYDVLRRIVEDEVERPSEDSELIDNDLEAVILTALAKEPEDRYPSAAVLRQDIENYLNGEALYARSLSRTYRLRKRIGRYRKPVVATLAVLAPLFAVIAGAVFLVCIEHRKRMEAEQAREISERRLAAHLEQREGAAPAMPLIGNRQQEPASVADREGEAKADSEPDPYPNALVGSKLVQWKTADGGNGHWYYPVIADNIEEVRIPWPEASEIAKSVGGYLVTITSSQENDFVHALVPPMTDVWLGAFQSDASSESDGAWHWVTGETMSFTRWQPDCDPYNVRDNEIYLSWDNRPGGSWNDVPSSWRLGAFVVEFDSKPPAADLPADFPDANLNTAIQRRTDMVQASLLDVQLLLDLNIKDYDVRSLKGISEASSLVSLCCDNNRLIDPYLMAGLPRLRCLEMQDCGLHQTDILFLANMPQLEILVLGDVRDLDPSILFQLSDLKALFVADCNITNLSFILNLPVDQITAMGILDNPISDLTPISSLRNLRSLYANDCQISDISPLASLKDLIWLDLRNNPLSPSAYTQHIPRIRKNNPGVNILIDPEPQVGAILTNKIVYVDADAVGANDGTSWTDAHSHLQDALVSTVKGDEIRVAQGTYRPDRSSRHPRGAGDRTATFRLKSGVVIKGGYAGSGEPDPNVRDSERYETVLSGDLNGNDAGDRDDPSRAENSYHVVTGSNTDETAVLTGVTITGGNANGTSPHDLGAGMYSQSGRPTLGNCTFLGNSAKEIGGGMCNLDSSPILTKCTFRGNSAMGGGGMSNGVGSNSELSSNPQLANCSFSENTSDDNGGAIYNYHCNPRFLRCEFTKNHAKEDGGAIRNDQSSPALDTCIFNGNTSANGSGLYNLCSSPTLRHCTFRGNSAGHGGGGIYNNTDCRSILTDCSFIGNAARFGGGMYNLQSAPELVSCTFNENTANEGGGGISNFEGSSPKLTKCVFAGNLADINGGAIVNHDDRPVFVDCTFTRNRAGNVGGAMTFSTRSCPRLECCILNENSSAQSGGAMFIWEDCKPVLINCTFTGNSSLTTGGGLFIGNNSSATLTSCVLWGDKPDELCLDASRIVATYSNIRRADRQPWPGLGNINADPLFTDPKSSDFHLLPDSPCVNAGDPNYAVTPDATDIDGEPRIMGGRVDMGADELRQSSVERHPANDSFEGTVVDTPPMGPPELQWCAIPPGWRADGLQQMGTKHKPTTSKRDQLAKVTTYVQNNHGQFPKYTQSTKQGTSPTMLRMPSPLQSPGSTGSLPGNCCPYPS